MIDRVGEVLRLQRPDGEQCVAVRIHPKTLRSYMEITRYVGDQVTQRVAFKPEEFDALDLALRECRRQTHGHPSQQFKGNDPVFQGRKKGGGR